MLYIQQKKMSMWTCEIENCLSVAAKQHKKSETLSLVHEFLKKGY